MERRSQQVGSASDLHRLKVERTDWQSAVCQVTSLCIAVDVNDLKLVLVYCVFEDPLLLTVSRRLMILRPLSLTILLAH